MSKAESMKSDRSASGLRDVLFQAIDDLRSGAIDVATANSISKAAETILKSVDTQINFEKLKLDSKVPGSLPEMPLVPRIGRAANGS